jgi:hypothetical protein
VQATQPYLAEVAPFAGNDWLQWVSGRATVGRFVDADGTPWLLLANRDSLNTQTLTLGLRGATGATRVDGGTPVWSISELSVTYSYVDLEPGDFALLRIDGTRGEALETLGPVVGAFANPVRGGLHVALDRVGGCGPRRSRLVRPRWCGMEATRAARAPCPASTCCVCTTTAAARTGGSCGSDAERA